MTNIIPFESASLPAHLRAGSGSSLVDDLFAGGAGGFPVLTIKGKVFAIKRGDEKQVITRPDDPDAPASSVELVVLRAQKALSKTFYLKGYVDGAAEAPDCSSSNGETPDANSPKPQATKCAICPHNQWGSKISDSGKELKACQDNKRLAVAAPGQLNDPMLLRVPPASFKALNEYAKLLKTRGVDFNAVVTKVSFVMDAATPQLAFKPVGFLDAAQYAEASELFHSDLVQQIVGLLPADDEPFETPAPAAKPAAAEPPADVIDPAPATVVDEAEQAVAAAAAKSTPRRAAKPAKPAPAPEPAPAAAAPAEDPVIDIDMDDALSNALESALADVNLAFDD